MEKKEYIPAVYTSKITGAKVNVLVTIKDQWSYLSSKGIVYYINELTF